MQVEGTELSLAGTPAADARGYVSWALAQGARDPYFILIVIYIFFPYFSNTVVGDPVRGQSLLGYTTAVAGFVLALMAPVLGAIADQTGRRKPWVALSAAVVALGATLLWWVRPGGEGLGIPTTLALIVVLGVAFTTSEMFHNAMLPSVAPRSRVGLVSGLAFASGNLGGLALMLLVLFAFALPGVLDWPFLPSEPWLGLDRAAHEPDRVVGPLTALWLVLLTAPLLLFTPDGAGDLPVREAARRGLEHVGETLRHLRHYSNIALYLGSRMLMIDGMVGVMTFGGVYASGVFAWGTITLLIFGLCTSASAMLGAIVGGRLDDRLGSRRTLQVSIAATTLLLGVLLSYRPDSILLGIAVSPEAIWSFPYFRTLPELLYLLTNQLVAIFFVTGLASSRTLMARLAPPQMATQFFGLFALSGTATAFLAPLLVGTTTAAFASQRAGMASLTLLLGAGFVGLAFVREEQAVAHRASEGL